MEWIDVMRTEQVGLIIHERMPQLTDVSYNAQIDKTIRFSDDITVLEGWTTWDRDFDKTLHVYSVFGAEELSAYAYVRSDLNGRKGAKGFFLIAKSGVAKNSDICVMNMVGVNYYSIAGSAC